jgi:LssY C-terminus
MHRNSPGRRHRIGLMVLGWWLCPVLTWAVTIPARTELTVRLTTEVTSKRPSGTAVSAVVVAPVVNGETNVVPRGSVLHGTTADVTPFQAADDQTEEKAAQLRIDFTQIQPPDGRSMPVSCVVTSVDNARESIDSAGLITGIQLSKTYGAMLDQGVNKVEQRYEGLGEFLSSIKKALFKAPDPAIDYKPGVDITIKLTQPLHWDAQTQVDQRPTIEPQHIINKIVAAEPLRTHAANPPKPSDLINLVFIGTEDQLQEAFHRAGWFTADALGRASKFETARAIVEDRGYDEAPVSVLYVEGQPPDLVFEKQNNTFAKRHHIRIWRRSQLFEGRPVWIAAATHDIKISFSQESRSFTHGIDSHIDLEREKVLEDLEFINKVQAFSFVSRPIPHDASNATGDRLITDGRVAVVELSNQ